MRMLELRAIYFDNRARIPEQNLCCRLHDSRFSRAGRAEEQEVTNRTPRRVQPRTENLIQVDERLYPLRLADNLCAKRAFKVPAIGTANGWIQFLSSGGFHRHRSLLLSPAKT